MMEWHADDDATPTPDEVDDMALVLEGQHGQFAADVAEFFVSVHSQRGDAARAWAWQGVAARVRRRDQTRGWGKWCADHMRAQ